MSIDKISDSSVAYLEQKHIVSILEEAFHQILVKLPDDPLEVLQRAFLSTTPLRLAVIGPLCSGKSKQCELIAKRYNLLHIQPEQLIAANAKSGKVDERSKQIAYCVENNIAIPDEIITELVIEATLRGEHDFNGWICDNFPQSRVQAIYLQTRAVCPQKLFLLNTSNDKCMQRYFSKVHEGSDTNCMQQLSRIEYNNADSHEILSRLSSFTARRSELVDCYKSFCVCVDDDDDDDDSACNNQSGLDSDGNSSIESSCTKSNDAKLPKNSVDKIFRIICHHVDELQKR